MRVLGVALYLPLVGCGIFAPIAGPGLVAGEACGSSLSCDDGLACECGVCSVPSGLPLACPDLSGLCPEPASDCFAACGDLTTLGRALCIDGVESCANVGGVLREGCDFSTCWGPPEAGEVCVAGTYVCPGGESLGGACYTADCIGEPALCVASCGNAGEAAEQRCIASEWRCEDGFPAQECGECRGSPPLCVLACDDPTPVAPAVCDLGARRWSCAYLVTPSGSPVLTLSCCEDADGGCGVWAEADDAGVQGGDGGG